MKYVLSRKIIVISGMLLFTVGFLLGLFAKGLTDNRFSVFLGENKIPGFIEVAIAGDVENVIAVNRDILGSKDLDIVEIEIKGLKVKSVLLKNLLDLAVCRAEEYSIVLTGQDYMTAVIKSQDLERSYIYFSYETGWSFSDVNLPASSAVKNLREITVVSQDNSYDDYAIGIIHNNQTYYLTAGQLYMSELTDFKVFEGESALKNNSSKGSVRVYKPGKFINLKKTYDISGPYKIIGRDGSENLTNDDGWLEFSRNRINYVFENKKDKIYDISGIVAESIKKSVSDVFHDSVSIIERGEMLMVIELDGLGYDMLMHSLENKPGMFLEGVVIQKAISVYPAISPVSLASMLTGQTPDIHGIKDRDNKNMLSEDIFAFLSKRGNTSKYIEGSSKLINTFTEPELNIKGSDGTSDENVFFSAMEAAGNYDFIFVHFHGIDDFGHKYGPYASQTINKVYETDEYIKQLASAFDGKIILVSDHGMRQLQTGKKILEKNGFHKNVSREEFIVPYAIFDASKLQDLKGMDKNDK